jgi:hypothetical protein
MRSSDFGHEGDRREKRKVLVKEIGHLVNRLTFGSAFVLTFLVGDEIR